MSSKTKRLTLLTTGLGIGGAEMQVLALGRKLSTAGWAVQVISMTRPQALVEEFSTSGLIVESLDMAKGLPDLRGIPRLARLVTRFSPSVMHSHMVHANILARIARPFTAVPKLLCTAHNIDEGGRWRELAYRATDFLCDLTTQVSKQAAIRYVNRGIVPRHKLISLPNGIDTDRYFPSPESGRTAREVLKIPADAFVFVAIGRFMPAKDYDNLLEACVRLLQGGERFYVLIAGDGPERPTIVSKTKKLHLDENVKFLGVRSDVNAVLNAANCLVLSSAWEGLPMVILEAASAGIPVVATSVGGVSEVVIDGTTGFLAPPRDPNALAQAMRRLLRLPITTRNAMGTAARQFVLENYCINTIASRWEEVYLSDEPWTLSADAISESLGTAS